MCWIGKSVFLSIVVCFMVFLSSGCSFTEQRVNRNTNESVLVDADLPSGGDLILIDSYESADEHLTRDIEKISQKLGFALLPKTAPPETFEFRLWTNLGGLGDAKSLIIRSFGNENHAHFFDKTRALDPISFRKDNLVGPKIGWNEMRFEVRSRLTTPKGLVRDPLFSLDRDEPVILLEVLYKGEYRRVFYGRNTSFHDGKRLIDFCVYISSEFGIEMDCLTAENRL